MRLKRSKCKAEKPKKKYVIEEHGSKMVLKETDMKKYLGFIITKNGKCLRQNCERLVEKIVTYFCKTSFKNRVICI